MPLTPQEAQLFVTAFQRALGSFTAGGAEAQPQTARGNGTETILGSGMLDRLLGSAAQLLDTLNVISGQLAAALEAQQAADTPDAPAPKKRGPKPKGENAAQSVASGDAGAAAPSNTEAQKGIGPAPVTTPLPIPGAASTVPPAAAQDDDPLGPMPDFLDRAPAAPPPPPPQTLSEQQMKDALRAYMQRHGAQGSAKLTNLLQTIGGVKRFSELPQERWPAVLQAVNSEMH